MLPGAVGYAETDGRFSHFALTLRCPLFVKSVDIMSTGSARLSVASCPLQHALQSHIHNCFVAGIVSARVDMATIAVAWHTSYASSTSARYACASACF